MNPARVVDNRDAIRDIRVGRQAICGRVTDLLTVVPRCIIGVFWILNLVAMYTGPVPC